jgi:hypothetical protein
MNSKQITFLPHCRGGERSEGASRLGVEVFVNSKCLPPPQPSPCKGEGVLLPMEGFV